VALGLSRGQGSMRPPLPGPDQSSGSVSYRSSFWLAQNVTQVTSSEFSEAQAKRMDRFVSTYTNRIDAKGRVSIPASFRAVLERDGYAGGIYCYPSLDAPALDAGGERLAKTIDGLLSGLPDYSNERDELSVALYGDVQVLGLDGDGRIVLPEALRAHAGITSQVTFVGLGQKFQMWEPGQFEKRRQRAREKVQDHRKLFGAGSRPIERAAGGDGGGVRE
jgi:MraZ protein